MYISIKGMGNRFVVRSMRLGRSHQSRNKQCSHVNPKALNIHGGILCPWRIATDVPATQGGMYLMVIWLPMEKAGLAGLA
jgi:hypothetical protein